MAQGKYPDELRYHYEHDWARIEEDQATLGITWYAQDSLGEVIFVEFPAVGSEVRRDSPYAEIESVKAVSDVYAPLSGEILAVNETLSESPDKINKDPYGEGWIVRIAVADSSEAEDLLDAAAYAKLLDAG